MINIPCRNFSVKVEKNNKDGTKTPVVYATLPTKAQLNHQLIILSVIDKFADGDDCREAKAVIDYVKNLK